MKTIDIEQLAAKLDGAAAEEGTLVDVREPDEFAAGRVPGALTIPMGQLPQRTDEIDPSGPVWVICRSGNRSKAMTDLLTAQGFEAYNVTGGTDAWIASGRAVEEG